VGDHAQVMPFITAAKVLLSLNVPEGGSP
jgi:hypothetical protein